MMVSPIDVRTDVVNSSPKPSDQPNATSELIRENTDASGVDSQKLGQDLSQRATDDPATAGALIDETLNQLPAGDREAVARALVEALPQEALDALAQTNDGAKALASIDAELATADSRLAGDDPQRALVQQATADNLRTVPAPPELAPVAQGFVAKFKALAQDPAAFHAALKDTYGTLDQTRAEQIRVATVNGDMSWMPRVAVVAGGDGQMLGAYAADQKTILLIESVLDEPGVADAVFAEEMGHHLETLLRPSDSQGDEGAVFARTLLGDDISPQALDALRHENDHGSLNVNGKEVTVEFSRFNPVRFDISNGGPIQGKEVDLGNGQTMVRVLGENKDIVGATNEGPVVNGRVVGPEDGFTDFRLERVAGTNNNYTVTPDTTPYEAVANATGIDWQTLDKAWLDLTAQGKTDEAAALRGGALPEITSFSAAVQTQLQPHYNRIAAQAKAPVAETPAPAPATPPSIGPFANGGPIAGEQVDIGDGRTMVRVAGMNVDIEDASTAGPMVNGRVVSAADGFSNFDLVKVEGTNNNYTLQPRTSPYDDLARATGIDALDLDKAYLELTAQGNTGAAEQLRQGTLPAPSLFQEGGISGTLQPYYTQLTQQVAIRHDTTPEAAQTALAELYTSDPQRAGEILLGRGELDLNLGDAVAEGYRGAHDAIYGASFQTIEGVAQAANIYVAAEALPEAQRDALRAAIDDQAAAAGDDVRDGFRAAIDVALDGDLAANVGHLTDAYASAREAHGDNSATTEIGRLAAVTSLQELRTTSDQLIAQSGNQVAYDTIEARFQDESLATLPAPLQNAMRTAIVGELGRINALEALASKDALLFNGDVAADAQLLAQHQDNLVPQLAASVRLHGVGQTMLNTAAAAQQAPAGAERDALLGALDTGWHQLRGDISFKNAERDVGSLDLLKEMVGAQEQIRTQYGEDAVITQSAERFVDGFDKDTTGTVGGMDIRVVPLIDYAEIPQEQPLTRDQMWLYASDIGLRSTMPEALALRNLGPETLDLILDTNRGSVDYTDAGLRQNLLDAQLAIGGDAAAIATKNEGISQMGGFIASNLEGKTLDQQREILANGGFGGVTGGSMASSQLGIRIGFNFDVNGIDYILGAANPADQRTRIDDVVTTGQAITDLQQVVTRAEALGSSKAFELAGSEGTGGPIPFIPAAVERAVDYGVRRGVIDSVVQQDTERAALGLTGWTDASADSAPPVKIEMSAWATAFASRIGEDEVAERTSLQIATSLSYVNRADTLGEQKVRAEQALQALITTHKIGTPPITLGEIGNDMIYVHPSFHEVRGRHYDEVAPFVGLPQAAGDERFSIDRGDWDYRLLNDETGAVVAARVKEASDTPTDAIISGVLTIASFIPVVNAVAIPLNAVYQAAQGIENGNFLQAAAGAFGVGGALLSGTIGTAAATASNFLTATNSVVVAVETGDPLAIAGAVFSAAGTVSDGIGVFNPDAKMASFDMSQVTAGFNMASASTDILMGVRDGQLALGLSGVADFTGAYRDGVVAGDADANVDLLNLAEDGLNIASDVAGVDTDNPWDIATTFLDAASDTVTTVAEFNDMDDIGGLNISTITSTIDAGSALTDVGEAVENDNYGEGLVSLGTFADELGNVVGTYEFDGISDTLTVGGLIANGEHDQALQMAVQSLIEERSIDAALADSINLTPGDDPLIGDDIVRDTFNMDDGTMVDRLTNTDGLPPDLAPTLTADDLPNAPLNWDERRNGNGDVELSVSELLILRETGDLFQVAPASNGADDGLQPINLADIPDQRTLVNPAAPDPLQPIDLSTIPAQRPLADDINRPDVSMTRPGDDLRATNAPTAAEDAARAQRMTEGATNTIDYFTNMNGWNLQEEALGSHLSETIKNGGGLEMVDAVIQELPASDRDDVVDAMLNNISADELNELARTDEGLDLILNMRIPMTEGVVLGTESANLNMLNRAYYSNETHLDTVIDMAGLADNVYNPSGATAGYERLNDHGMPPALANETWHDDATGFNAALYRSTTTGQIVLALEGTSSQPLTEDWFNDWGNNGQNGIGFSSEQYESAITLAESVRQYYGEDVVLTGHSLAGGMAAAASAVTGLDAFTFNAAGPHSNTLASYNVTREQALGTVQAFNIHGDLVTSGQEALGPTAPFSLELFPNAVGHRFELPALMRDGSQASVIDAHPLARHGMDYVLRGLEAQRAP